MTSAGQTIFPPNLGRASATNMLFKFAEQKEIEKFTMSGRWCKGLEVLRFHFPWIRNRNHQKSQKDLKSDYGAGSRAGIITPLQGTLLSAKLVCHFQDRPACPARHSYETLLPRGNQTLAVGSREGSADRRSFLPSFLPLFPFPAPSSICQKMHLIYHIFHHSFPTYFSQRNEVIFLE